MGADVAIRVRAGGKSMDERKKDIARVVLYIQTMPDATDKDEVINDLVRRWGIGIKDDIIDALVPNSYSDALQEQLNNSGAGRHLTRTAEDKAGPALKVCQLDYLIHEPRTKSDQCLELLTQLLAREVYNIPRLLMFSNMERWVWFLWLRRYALLRMSVAIYEKRGSLLAVDELQQILISIQNRTLNESDLGWLTAMQEDIARGPNSNRPDYWSLCSFLSRSD